MAKADCFLSTNVAAATKLDQVAPFHRKLQPESKIYGDLLNTNTIVFTIITAIKRARFNFCSTITTRDGLLSYGIYSSSDGHCQQRA